MGTVKTLLISISIVLFCACSDLETYTFLTPESSITQNDSSNDNTADDEENLDTEQEEDTDTSEDEDFEYDSDDYQQITDCQVDGAALIYAGDDLTVYLDSVDKNGNFAYDQFIIVDATDYYLGEYYTTRSISISACDPDNRPTIHGSIYSSNTDDAITIEISDIIFDGAEYNYTYSDGSSSTMKTLGQMFIAKTAGTVTMLYIDGCIIKNYTKGVCYDNTGATISNICIFDCVCDSIGASDGGAIFDFRKGTLSTLVVSNSTFMNGSRDFTRIASSATVTTFCDCTFFRVCTSENSNNSGLIRQSSGYLSMINCVVDQLGTTDGETYVERGYWTKNASNYGAEFYYSNVYYCNSQNIWTGYLTSAPDGVSEAQTGVATSNFNTTSDGYIDITIQNSGFPDNVGDPRWYY